MTTPNLSSDAIHAAIVHKISDFYKRLYLGTKKLTKIDRYGLRLKTEQQTIDCFRLAIKAALTKAPEKISLIQDIKIEIETIKQLIRVESELSIINEKEYFLLQEPLQEISRDATNWLNYFKPAKEPRQ